MLRNPLLQSVMLDYQWIAMYSFVAQDGHFFWLVGNRVLPPLELVQKFNAGMFWHCVNLPTFERSEMCC